MLQCIINIDFKVNNFNIETVSYAFTEPTTTKYRSVKSSLTLNPLDKTHKLLWSLYICIQEKNSDSLVSGPNKQNNGINEFVYLLYCINE